VCLKHEVNFIYKKKFDDTKDVIWSLKFEDRKWNFQKKRDNHIQKTVHRKVKNEQHESHKISEWTPVPRKELAVPAALMAPVVLLLNDTNFISYRNNAWDNINRNYIKFVRDLCFFPVNPVSSTRKTDCHEIAEILLKVALNSISLTLTPQWNFPSKESKLDTDYWVIYCFK